MSRALAKSYARSVIPDKENREKDDFYPTPPEGTEALLKVERFDGLIWECACGDGAISKVLEAHGYDVLSTDLVDRGYGEPRVDFLMERVSPAPNIVTNPPFKLAQQFVEHALSLTTGKVAILARLSWLESVERREMFIGTPLARVWIFSKRLHILRRGVIEKLSSGGGMIAFAWYVWEHGHEGKPTLGWLEPHP